MLQMMQERVSSLWQTLLALHPMVQAGIIIFLGLMVLYLWLRPKNDLERSARQEFGWRWYASVRDWFNDLRKNQGWWQSKNQVHSALEIAMILRGVGGGKKFSFTATKFILLHLSEITTHPNLLPVVTEEKVDALINIADDHIQRRTDTFYGLLRSLQDVAAEFKETVQADWQNPKERKNTVIMVSIATLAVLAVLAFLVQTLTGLSVPVAGSSQMSSQPGSRAAFPAIAPTETPFRPLQAGTPRVEKGPLLLETEDYIVSTVFSSLYSYVGGGQVVIENERGQAQLLEVDGALYILVQGLASKRYCPSGSTETDHKKCVQAELRSYVDSVQKHLDYLVQEEVESYSFSDDFAQKLDLAKKMGQVVKNCSGIFDIYVQCGKPGDNSSNICQQQYQQMVDLQDEIDEILRALPNQPTALDDPLNYFKERIIEKAEFQVSSDHPLAETLKLREWQTPLLPEGTPSTPSFNVTPSPGQTPLPTATIVSGNGDVERVLKELSEKVKKTVVMIGFIEEPRSETEPGSEAGATAFRIDAEGYLITNYHVVDEEYGLLGIRLPNGTKKYTKSTLPIWFYGEDKERTATLIAYDSEHDVALLKLNEPVGSDYLELGDSGSVQKGQIVFAVGYPFLSEQQINYRTVTNPIVKPELIDMNGNKYYGEYDMIEVDVTLNPGNSGGPLLDINGKVLGVNSLIKLKSGKRTVFEGIGYALPVDPWVKDLIQQGIGR